MKLYEIRIDIPNDRIKRNPYMNQVGQSAGNGLHGKFSLSGLRFTPSPGNVFSERISNNILSQVDKMSQGTALLRDDCP